MQIAGAADIKLKAPHESTEHVYVFDIFSCFRLPVHVWQVTPVGPEDPTCTLHGWLCTMFTINMLFIHIGSKAIERGMKSICWPRAATLLPPLSESYVCKLAENSRQDMLTLSRCVRNEETLVWALF